MAGREPSSVGIVPFKKFRANESASNNKIFSECEENENKHGGRAYPGLRAFQVR